MIAAHSGLGREASAGERPQGRPPAASLDPRRGGSSWRFEAGLWLALATMLLPLRSDRRLGEVLPDRPLGLGRHRVSAHAHGPR